MSDINRDLHGNEVNRRHNHTAKTITTWRYWQIRPNYGGRAPWLSRNFYAPSQSDAFIQARSQWPGADSWECLGSLAREEL